MRATTVVPERVQEHSPGRLHLDWRCNVDTIPQDIPQKQCTACQQWLPATPEFFHRSGERGLYPQCKVCKREKHKLSYYRPENYERTLARHNAYLRRPEIRERERARRKVYKNRPEVKEHNQEWWDNYLSRPEVKERINNQRSVRGSRPEKQEQKRSYDKEYKQRPEVRERDRIIGRAQQQKRRARKNSVGGSYTPEQAREQYARQKGKCYWCEKKVIWGKHHEDHVIPLSRGGSNDIFNIVIACPHCNWSRNDRLPGEWAKSGKLL